MKCSLCGEPLPHPPLKDTPCYCGETKGWPDNYPEGHGWLVCRPIVMGEIQPGDLVMGYIKPGDVVSGKQGETS